MTAKGFIKQFAEGLFGFEAALAARWSSAAHRRLLRAQWSLPPAPTHFDHQIDLHHQWLHHRNPMWLERGMFSLVALKGGDVLELSCGDGFNTRNFYSLKSRRVVGCDIDPQALDTAQRKNAAPNVEYVAADIRVALPPGRFDNVVWDFAFPLLQYFSPAQLEEILRLIRASLASEGVLSGCTMPLDSEDAGSARGCRFHQPDDLCTLLQPHFRHVAVYETRYPDRRNFYFWASDGPLPMTPEWRHASVS